MSDFCVGLLMNLFLITLGASIFILIMLACSKLFRKRYGAAVKQLLWILLAFRMLVVIIFSNTFYRIDLLNWKLDNGEDAVYEYQYVNASQGMLTEKKENASVVYGFSKKGKMNPGGTAGRVDPEEVNEMLPYLQGDRDMIRDYFEFYSYHEETEAVQGEKTASVADNIQRGFAAVTGFVYRYVDIIGGIWLAGFILFWLYHLAVWFYFHRKVVQSRQLAEDAFYLQALEEAVEYTGLKKTPKLYFYHVSKSESDVEDPSTGDSADDVAAGPIDSPMVTGIFHPIVWLPAGKYSPELLQAILRHELSHIAHRDLPIKLIYLAANSMHWFNPLVYVMVHQACRDMELYCDAEVVASASREEREQYNEQLYSLLKVEKVSYRKQYFSTCYSGNVREMKLRFLNNLDEKRKRYGWLPVTGLALLILVSGLTVKVTATTTHYTYTDDAEDENYNDFEDYNYSEAGYPYEQISIDTYSWGRVIPEIEPCTIDGDDGFYAVPVYMEDYIGNIIVELLKVPGDGKEMTQAPEILIMAGTENIIDYGVKIEGYPADRASFGDNSQSVQDEESFFTSQAAKGEANPLIDMGEVSDYGNVGSIFLYFPDGEMPDVVVVRDVVLNDDGTSRYKGQIGEVVYRRADLDDALSCVSFGLANHSGINLYEDWNTDKSFGDPFLRGYQVRCDWVQEDGVYSCTYLFALRTREAL